MRASQKFGINALLLGTGTFLGGMILAAANPFSSPPFRLALATAVPLVALPLVGAFNILRDVISRKDTTDLLVDGTALTVGTALAATAVSEKSPYNIGNVAGGLYLGCSLSGLYHLAKSTADSLQPASAVNDEQLEKDRKHCPS